MNGHGFGTFMLGLTAGAAAGAALGMTIAPSQRRGERAARPAAQPLGGGGGGLFAPPRLPWDGPAPARGIRLCFASACQAPITIPLRPREGIDCAESDFRDWVSDKLPSP